MLQERDIKILAFILRYKYVCTKHIHDWFFENKSKVAVHKVLKRLSNLKVIQRIHFPRTKNLNVGDLIFITGKGASCLATEWGVSIKELGYRRTSNVPQSINHYYHRKRMVDLLIHLDKDLLGFENLTLKKIATDAEREYRNDQMITKTYIQTSDHKVFLIPDIYFIIKNAEKKEVLWFVEIDTGKETIGGKFSSIPVNSLLAKYQSYEKILKDGHWLKQIQTSAKVFQILTVTETEKHISTINEQCSELLQFPQLFLFSTHDQVDKFGVLNHEIWNGFDTQEGKRKLLL